MLQFPLIMSTSSHTLLMHWIQETRLNFWIEKLQKVTQHEGKSEETHQEKITILILGAISSNHLLHKWKHGNSVPAMSIYYQAKAFVSIIFHLEYAVDCSTAEIPPCSRTPGNSLAPYLV